MFEGISLQLEAAAQATSTVDLFARLEAAQQLLRVDPRVEPTMFRGPTISIGEMEQLRRIEGVVRLGKVRGIESDRIVLDGGTIPTSPRHLHVHCAAEGLNPAAETPIFTAGRITLQSIRIGLLPFASALIAYVEATRDDLEAQNRLCPPSRQPNVPLDWARGMVIGMKAANRWSKEPDIADWLERARLNMLRGLQQHDGEPRVQQAFMRFATNVRQATGESRATLCQFERSVNPIGDRDALVSALRLIASEPVMNDRSRAILIGGLGSTNAPSNLRNRQPSASPWTRRWRTHARPSLWRPTWVKAT